MRVLIIGGTGFIGPHVVRRLREQSAEVAVFHRGRTEPDLPPQVLHFHAAGLESLPEFTGEIKRFRPDVALYMRPIGEQDSQTVMAALTGVVARIVAVSSQDVYRAYGRLIGTEPGPPDPIPLTEQSPLRERLYPYRGPTPRDPQDARRWADDYDKILAERVLMGNPRLPGTILRLPMVYGPGDTQHRLWEYLKRMDDGRPAILLDERAAGWRWTRAYVEDVAGAIALAVTDGRAAGKIYNVGEPQALPLAEWVRSIGQAAGWQGKIISLPGDRLPAPLRAEENTAQDLVVDSSRIRQELGYAERAPLAEALARTVAWERANPPQEFDPLIFDYAAEDAAIPT